MKKIKLNEEFFGKLMARRKPKMGTGIDPKKSCTGIWKIWKQFPKEKTEIPWTYGLDGSVQIK